MHGVKRSRIPPVPDSVEVQRKKKEKELVKIKEYKGMMDALYEKNEKEEYTRETLELCSNVLGVNPEFQTGWGIRRTIMLKGLFVNADDSVKQAYLDADLKLTLLALKQYPKTYCIYEHRKWVLETMPEADWAWELMFVEGMLEKDARNFHGWDYRRYIVTSVLSLDPSNQENRKKPLPKPTTQSELAYTRRKISESFSNFSAWHYRTKLLPKLWDENGWEEGNEDRVKQVAEEFDLVENAIFTDPNDQSAWLYHRWLVGKGTIPVVRAQLERIGELAEEEPDSRWCLDSLIYYKRLLVTLLGTDEATREEREKLNEECLKMLNTLKEVDPMRKERYRDLSVHILPNRR